MNTDPKIRYRRAIEALRNGVPNRAAVEVLGCNQKEIEERFRKQLQSTRLSVKEGLKNEGILVADDFGTGKSHLLEYLMHIALEENFVCSKVVISKETPLFNSVKLYRAAAEAAILTGKRGNAITEVATALDPKSQGYASFCRWAHETSDLNKRFPATLFLFERVQNDQDLINRIIRFWAGEKMDVSEIRGPLRALGEATTYKIDKIPIKDLALQRFKFAARLIVAAGYAGWVLLLDEIELIRHYSWLQRAKSYAELARWMGKLEGEGLSGLTCVLAIVKEFEEKVLMESDDLNKIPGRLRAKGAESDFLLASQAERGMQIIRKEAVPLPAPESLYETYRKIHDVYKEAYGWESDQMAQLQGETSRRIRQYIRGWVTEWDLRRLYKDYIPDIVSELPSIGYTEDLDLQKETEEGSDT